MGHPGAHLEKHRAVEGLGNLIGPHGEGPALGAVGGFQHGELGGAGIVPGVLLVLGGVHPGVVRHADDHAGVDAGVRHGKQRVRRHVQSHVLHAAETALSRETGPKGRLHGHFLVGCPLAVDFVVLGGLLRNLRTGGAGIAGDERASRLVKSPGNRRVAQHQLFHDCLSLCSSQNVFHYNDTAPGVVVPPDGDTPRKAHQSGASSGFARPSRRITCRMTPPAPPSSMDRRTRLTVALLAPVLRRMSE